MSTLIIGLDAASGHDKFGFAIGRVDQHKACIEAAGCLSPNRRGQAQALDVIVGALLSLRPGERALIAIDAPLGWPTPISKNLIAHKAGDPITSSKDALFRRTTDLRLRDRKHRPLEVGADRIARAAVEALVVLQVLRDRTGLSLPLVWSPLFSGAGVIEVYPAATLRERNLQSSQYKKPDQSRARHLLAEALEHELFCLDRYADGSPDRFDACLCLLCARDFLADECESPQICDTVIQQEGWIWLRKQRV